MELRNRTTGVRVSVSEETADLLGPDWEPVLSEGERNASFANAFARAFALDGADHTEDLDSIDDEGDEDDGENDGDDGENDGGAGGDPGEHSEEHETEVHELVTEDQPSLEWTVARLTDFANDNDISLGAAIKKAEILEAILAALDDDEEDSLEFEDDDEDDEYSDEDADAESEVDAE